MIELEKRFKHLGKMPKLKNWCRELAIAHVPLGPDHLSTLTAMNDLAFIIAQTKLAKQESLIFTY